MIFGVKNKWKFIENGYGNESSLDSTDVETFKKDPIASLARESTQNSIDARRGEHSVLIQFKPFVIRTADIPGINDFKNELIACRDSHDLNTKYYKKFDNMINEVSKENISCLRISDFYTKGLEGVKSNDRNKAFYYLTKGNGLTTKISSNSGGSKGIGKFASFVASSLQTVFYSTLNENNERGYIGITKLASRLLNSETGMCTTGYGYYSRTDRVYPILEEINLDKDFKREDDNYGTDIYIIGFKSESTWKKEIITKVLDSFMAAIQYGDLEVKVDDVYINTNTLKLVVYDDNYITAVEKKNILAQYILLNDEFVYKKDIEIGNYGIIKVFLKDFARQDEWLATNKCVMIRYPYMKITDFKIPFAVPCSAMCIIQKDELNSILKEVENPQHTDWEPNRIIDESFRREVIKIIKNIKNEISQFANECLLNGQNVEIDMEGAGDYLPDSSLEDSSTLSVDDKVIEKPKVINRQRIKIKISNGSVDDESSNSLIPDVGTHEEGEGSPIPEGENVRQSGDVHDATNETGYTNNGDDIIMKFAPLAGLKSRVLIVDKNHGEYLVTFKSISDEKNCELELFYLDDIGNKYKPNILGCKINENDFELIDGKIKGFEISKDVRYKILIKTDLDDIYACEVKVYASR